jgi:hypothetical protein
LALVAMLAHLADEPFDLRPLTEYHTSLAPVVLADACQTPRHLRQTVVEGARHGLVTGEVSAAAVSPSIRAQVRESLTAAERRFGAEAAIAAMDCLYPPTDVPGQDLGACRRVARACVRSLPVKRRNGRW